MGDLYSTQDFIRDYDNHIYVNAKGKVETRSLNGIDEYIKLGSVLPKANMAWRNDFSIGNFNIALMITARLGGIVYSRTQAVLDYYGVSEVTADARDNGIFKRVSETPGLSTTRLHTILKLLPQQETTTRESTIS